MRALKNSMPGSACDKLDNLFEVSNGLFRAANFRSQLSRRLYKTRAIFSMSPLLIKISKDFATLWATIDQACAT
jgi:hypothetical protein